MSIDKQYLNIPLRNAAVKRSMTVKIDGQFLGEFQTPLARSEPDYYGFFDLSRYRGKTLAIEVDRFPRDVDHRREDGSIHANVGNGYGGSNNQQPRIVNEVHSTMMDLNCHAKEIMAMQRLRKPIRIFYSKTSAINKPDHMDDVFDLYESLFFEGIPLGFVRRDILQNEGNTTRLTMVRSRWSLML